MRARGARHGLTLIEVLLVLVLVLTLLGLLATYLVRQRESAFRVQCANNLKRSGEAAITFSEGTAGTKGKGFLPAARIADGYATWAVQIAPGLTAGHPLLTWDPRKPFAEQDEIVRQTALMTFFCPARLRQRAALVSAAGALGDYAGVAGNGDPAHDWTGPEATGTIILGEVLEKKDDLILRWHGRVRLADLKRGRSYTPLFGEKYIPEDGLGEAKYGDGSLYDGTFPANSSRVGGPGHGLARSPNDPYRENFGSAHPGICQFVQADTSVRPLAIDLDDALLGQLTTRGE